SPPPLLLPAPPSCVGAGCTPASHRHARHRELSKAEFPPRSPWCKERGVVSNPYRRRQRRGCKAQTALLARSRRSGSRSVASAWIASRLAWSPSRSVAIACRPPLNLANRSANLETAGTGRLSSESVSSVVERESSGWSVHLSVTRLVWKSSQSIEDPS